MSRIEIRPLTTAEEVNAGFRVFLRAMVGLPFRDVDAAEVTEPGRFLGALDGAEVVGSADSYAGWLVVPGGARVPHAAVTHIGVLPTHRRRGIVSRLVARPLQDIAARGEAVVLEVRDPLLPANGGRFEVGPKSVTRTDAPPDLGVDVATLAATYLGGTRWQHLAATGRVTVHDPDAVRRADDLFATASLPFSGVVF